MFLDKGVIPSSRYSWELWLKGADNVCEVKLWAGPQVISDARNDDEDHRW
jgi:hypothetical protein